MKMFNPPHPGEFIYLTYVEPFGLSQNEVARRLHVSPSTFNRLVNGDSDISPEMALKLSKVFGRTPESWMNMQSMFDLNRAEKKLTDLSDLMPFNFNVGGEGHSAIPAT